jgi:endonuclease/exonuclease/phosphatase family metal-dependent hydrolase
VRLTARAGWAVPAAALVVFVWLEMLRVWMPSVLFVVGDAGRSSPVIMGVFALGVLAVPLVLASGIDRLPIRLLWMGGAVILAAARAAMLVTDGGTFQATVATAATLGGAIALVALAAWSPNGHAARSGVLFGLLGSVSVHAALRTHDLVWDTRPAAQVVSIVLVLALLATALLYLRERQEAMALATPDDPVALGAAWPWLVLTPLLLLVLVLSGVPGRMAVAAPAWPNSRVVLVIVLAHGAAGVGALVAPRLGAAVSGAVGGGLTLIGTALALQAVGLLAISGQIAIAIGLAFVVGSLHAVTGSSGPRGRAVATSGALLLFGLFTFAYYAAYGLQLPLNNRVLLLIAAVLGAVIGGVGALAAVRGSVRPRLDASTLIRTTAAVLLVAVLSGLVTAGPEASASPPADGDGGVRVALYNLNMGFDPQGRFAIRELVDVLRAESPDVIVLNEVDRGWLVSGGHDVLELVAAELGLPYRFAPAADEVWGNALLSRYPVSEWTADRLPRGSDPMARSQFAAVIEIPEGRSLAVVGTQLSIGATRADTRLPQARAVAATVARLRERNLPTVVLGDLNATRDGPELATFASLGMTSVLGSGTPTWPSWDPELQIDHILVSPDLMPSRLSVRPVMASDHLPVAVTVRVRDAPD